MEPRIQYAKTADFLSFLGQPTGAVLSQRASPRFACPRKAARIGCCYPFL